VDPASCILYVLFLLLSSYFAATETAYTAVSKVRMRTLADKGNKRAKRVLWISDRFDKTLTTILIGNNIVNIAASSLTTTLVYEMYGNEFVSLATGVLTVVVLLCGEIMPKTLAGKYAEKIAMAYGPILFVLIKVMTPVIWIVNLISAFFMRIFGIETKATDTRVTEDVLKTMLDMSLEDDQIEPEEHEIINNVLEANEFCAKDIMVPRGNVVGITDEYTYEEVIETFKSEKYSRLVVLDEDKGVVLGILHMKDVVFLEPEEFDMHKLLRSPYFTCETKKTQDILTELRRTSNSMAVVLDEYGELVGILTIEDIIEEFVGQIRDEYDGDELKQIEKIDENVYKVEGSLNLSDLNNAIGLELESENYNSVGGFIIEKLEEFPKAGDKLDTDVVHFEVLDVENNRIEKVRITIKQSDD
jgi:CBS domain containing-hemolysin-like protein